MVVLFAFVAYNKATNGTPGSGVPRGPGPPVWGSGTPGTPGSPGSQKFFFGKDIFQLKKKFFFGPGLGPVAPKNAKKRTYEHF